MPAEESMNFVQISLKEAALARIKRSQISESMPASALKEQVFEILAQPELARIQEVSKCL